MLILSVCRGAVRRYLQGKAKWDKKVSLARRVSGEANTLLLATKYVEKRIHERRRQNVRRAAREEAKRLKSKANRRRHKQASKTDDEESNEEDHMASTWHHIDGERPPPSSIAARRDTVSHLPLTKDYR
jgi:hypothetical protein